MKFYNEKFTVNKACYSKVVHWQNLLEEMIPRRAVVHNVIVTTEGLTYNEYSGVIQNVITVDALYEKRSLSFAILYKWETV